VTLKASLSSIKPASDATPGTQSLLAISWSSTPPWHLQGVHGKRLHLAAAAPRRVGEDAHAELVYEIQWQTSHTEPTSPSAMSTTGWTSNPTSMRLLACIQQRQASIYSWTWRFTICADPSLFVPYRARELQHAAMRCFPRLSAEVVGSALQGKAMLRLW